MIDDLVDRLRDLGDRAAFEPHMHHEAAAEITRLRAERIAEISARFKAEGEFSTMQRAIARQRRALAKMYQRRHHRNALINHLIAALATARREGMEQAATIVINLSISAPSVVAAAIRAAAGGVK